MRLWCPQNIVLLCKLSYKDFSMNIWKSLLSSLVPTWYLLAQWLSAEKEKKMRVDTDVSIMAREDTIWDSPNQLLLGVATVTVMKSPWGLESYHRFLFTQLRNCHLSVSAFSSKLVFPQEINTKLAVSSPHHGAECGADYQRMWDARNLKSFYPQSKETLFFPPHLLTHIWAQSDRH